MDIVRAVTKNQSTVELFYITVIIRFTQTLANLFHFPYFTSPITFDIKFARIEIHEIMHTKKDCEL